MTTSKTLVLERIKFRRLLTYIYHKEKYLVQFRKSLLQDLYDFSIILIWKMFLLFIYEKLQQIPGNLIKEAWKNKHSKELKGFKENNLYWPNTQDDELIISFLYEIYDNIDKNVVKIANSLSIKRDAAAHVSDIDCDISDVDRFLEEILKLCSKIQRAHAQYLEKFDLNEVNKIIIAKNFSVQDIKFFVGKFINLFKESGSFKEAREIRKNISLFKGYISREDIIKIVKAIQENSIGHSYHQILQTGGTDTFIKELYDIYGEASTEWKNFAKFIKEDLLKRGDEGYYLANYNWLFEIFNMETFRDENLLKEPPPEDIPF